MDAWRPTPTNHLPILSGIQPAELRRLGATFSLAYCGSLEPDHMLHGLLSGSSDARQEKLKFKRPFVPTARNLLNNLAGLGIRASEWTNYRWDTEYYESTSRLCVFIPMIDIHTKWIKLGPNSLVQTQSVLGDSIHPCTNGVSLLHLIPSADH